MRQKNEGYRPNSTEIERAEGFMNENERLMSKEREKIFRAIDARNDLLKELNEGVGSDEYVYAGRYLTRERKQQDSLVFDKANLQPLTAEEATLRARIPEKNIRPGEKTIFSFEAKDEEKNYIYESSAHNTFVNNDWIKTSYGGRITGGYFSFYISPDHHYAAQIKEQELWDYPDGSYRDGKCLGFDAEIRFFYLDFALIYPADTAKDSYAYLTHKGLGSCFQVVFIKDKEDLEDLVANVKKFADPETVENYKTGKISSQIIETKEDKTE
ncbi:MAG: hypothetical protein CEN88_328 [Candidatus Berkelbacteria bacterium Licking1014_2]|uniref:Uncharacterized protein n=1 Tax=Candidatus Berkelbacteria bacterium Licking1014_2 TaxID=2017146 RepID=A0A554LV49_9BACT|nr:MAG: hypothetical protein CEN88_328 [Candidatus Berkelbacteria bacterium Licking1014_2]